MRVAHRRLLIATGMLALATVTGAVDAEQPVPASSPDVATLGPQPGQPVPDFALSDQRGTRRTLGSLMGPKGLVLFFNRSVDW